MSDFEGYTGIDSAAILPRELKKEKKEVKKKTVAEKKQRQRLPRKKTAVDRKDNIHVEAPTPNPTPVIAPNPAPVANLPAGVVSLTATTKIKKARKPSAWNECIKKWGMPLKGTDAYTQMMQDYEQMKKKYAVSV